MMIPDPAIIGSIFLLASAGQGGAGCVMPQPLAITVEPATQEIKYDTSRSLEEIQGVALDSINPYGLHAHTQTKGYMQGKISMRPEIKLGHAPSGPGGICLWYEEIKVSFDIDPTIVIGREVAEDPCLYEAVKEHELKHVMADRQIVNKYADIMGRKIQDTVREIGVITERPVHPDAAQGVATRMQKTVIQVLEHEYRKMDLERTEVQRAIDTKEEYERVRSLCE